MTNLYKLIGKHAAICGELAFLSVFFLVIAIFVCLGTLLMWVYSFLITPVTLVVMQVASFANRNPHVRHEVLQGIMQFFFGPLIWWNTLLYKVYGPMHTGES